MNEIEKQSFLRRFVIPTGILLIVWLAFSALISALMGRPATFGTTAAYRIIMNTLSGLRFVLLLFGSLVIYPIMFFRGATLIERVIGSLVVPLAYMLWAMVQATAYFPVGESIYYGFNSIAFGSLFFQFALLSIADIFCRWWVRRKHQARLDIVRWPHMIGISAGLTSIYVSLIWDGGVHWFYLYQEVYKLLFT